MEMNEDSQLSSEIRLGEIQHRERYKKAWERKSRRIMKMSREEILGMVPLNNMCLVSIPRKDIDFMEVFVGKGDMQIDVKYRPMMWAPTLCRIETLPRELNWYGDNMVDAEWRTEIEVEIGDMVVCRYLPVARALGMGDGIFGNSIDPEEGY